MADPTEPAAEVVAEGRMAEILAAGDGRVVKLDRPEVSGVALFEASILREAAMAGLPVPAVIETVVVEGRHGILMERLEGPSLDELVAAGERIEELADAFVDLHLDLHRGMLPTAPALVDRTCAEIERSGLPAVLIDELLGLLDQVAVDDPVGVCHFDLHPGNVIVTAHGWRVIDWLTAATGPVTLDFARTLLLRAQATGHACAFAERVCTAGIARRGLSEEMVESAVRVCAAARLAEGFDGPYAEWLVAVARGGVTS